MPTSSFLISLPKCLGKLAGRRPGLKLKRFLDGILHWAVAIEGAHYSQHNALESTLLNHSGTASRATTLEVSPDFVPGKATNILLRPFCWDKIKNYLLVGAASTTWEILPATQCWLCGDSSPGGRALVEKKNFGDKAIDR